MERVRHGTPEDPVRLAILISGSGSGMESLIKHQHSQDRAHITTLVISNQPEVRGIKRAELLGVECIVCTVDTSITDGDKRRQEHEKRLLDILTEHDIELVILSGYMRILSPFFVNKWAGRLLNIHPSLLPKYPGAHAHRDALADGAEITGCTVHLVDEGVDSGPILGQREVPILPGDNEQTLSERVKLVEHELYPAVIDAYCISEDY